MSEAALRIIGFSFTLAPVVEVGWPDPQTLQTRYRPDADLFWVTRDYDERVSAARAARPDVVFMGDSCTEFGHYPAYTVEQLRPAWSRDAHGVSLAAGGWTSEQGVSQLERDIVPLRPRIVTVYFGWNDHWMALGPADRELRRITGRRKIYETSRLAQLILKVQIGRAPLPQERPNRVPLDDYRANLTRIVEVSREAGIIPVLLTAPSNHVRGSEPEYLLKRHVRALDELVPLHEAYTEATRAVGAQTGAAVCDLAKAFDALPPPRGRYFQRDGIHFTDEGDHAIAGILSKCLAPLYRP